MILGFPLLVIRLCAVEKYVNCSCVRLFPIVTSGNIVLRRPKCCIHHVILVDRKSSFFITVIYWLSHFSSYVICVVDIAKSLKLIYFWNVCVFDSASAFPAHRRTLIRWSYCTIYFFLYAPKEEYCWLEASIGF